MAVGLVIVSHCDLGTEFLKALKLIVPDAREFHAISFQEGDKLDEMRTKVLEGIRAADENEGVLILTDMFGGSPSNIALSFHEERHVEVVTGMNLPMLVKLANPKGKETLEELAKSIKEYGRRNISVASQLLPEDASE
ncbi:MAG: hypothetical protein OSB70_09460 [Myxococcota bacterium]|nr:hypothetical protein [Myxococcota bacterium]